MSSKPALKLDWCSHEAAKFAVEHWHYSKTMPIGKLCKIGVWEDSKFIGCVMYGLGANRQMASALCDPEHACELVRIALSSHKSPVSRIVSISLAMLRKKCPKLKVIVSYADKRQGHHGGVYQAGGWAFIGESQKTTEWFHGGRWKHNREMTGGPFGKKRRLATEGIPNRVAEGKLKYVMPLDEEIKRTVDPLRKPYPKRVRSVDSDTSTIHAEEGGANPTRTL